MDEMYDIILNEGYGMKLKSAARTRTCLVCTTDKGIFDLKKNIYDENIVVFEGEIKKCLKGNGFDGVIPFEETLDGNIFYEYNDCRYTLEAHKNFIPPADDGKWDYMKAARVLAHMHNASFMDSFVCERKNYGRLESIYEKRIIEFKRIRKRIKKDGVYDKADMLIKKYYDYYLNRAQTALEMLKKSNYSLLSKYAEEKRCFCHNGFKGENIKTEVSSGKIYVDNFGKASYDIYVSDLAYYIRRLIKREDTNAENIENAIKEYSSVRPVDGDERTTAFAMVVFPQKFMNLCNEYYNKRKVFTFDASVQRIERCTEAIKKEESIINII